MNNFKVMWFMLQHPKTWIDLSPLQIRKGRLIYDLNLTMMYGLVLGLVLFGRYLFF
jgi:hypothetical protein